MRLRVQKEISDSRPRAVDAFVPAPHLAWRPWPASLALARAGHASGRLSPAASMEWDSLEPAAAPIPDAQSQCPRVLPGVRGGQARFASLHSLGARRWIFRALPWLRKTPACRGLRQPGSMRLPAEPVTGSRKTLHELPCAQSELPVKCHRALNFLERR